VTESADINSTVSPPPRKRGFPAWVIFIAVVLAVSFSVKLVIDTVSRAPARMVESALETARGVAGRAAAAIQEVFQVIPEVQLQSKVIQLQSTPIAELALIERGFKLSNTWRGKWLRSEKELTVSGSYTAKAGFDLEKRFKVDVNETDRQVYLYLPLPELLSVELSDDLELQGKSGLWNRVTDEDRNLVMNDFRRAAEVHALASDILEVARQEAEKRLRDALPAEDWEMIIIFDESNLESDER
jgi:hypothetical protein